MALCATISLKWLVELLAPTMAIRNSILQILLSQILLATAHLAEWVLANELLNITVFQTRRLVLRLRIVSSVNLLINRFLLNLSSQRRSRCFQLPVPLLALTPIVTFEVWASMVSKEIHLVIERTKKRRRQMVAAWTFWKWVSSRRLPRQWQTLPLLLKLELRLLTAVLA